MYTFVARDTQTRREKKKNALIKRANQEVDQQRGAPTVGLHQLSSTSDWFRRMSATGGWMSVSSN